MFVVCNLFKTVHTLYVCEHACMHACVRACVCVCACVRARAHARVRACVCVRMLMCVLMYGYVCLYMCAYVHIYAPVQPIWWCSNLLLYSVADLATKWSNNKFVKLVRQTKLVIVDVRWTWSTNLSIKQVRHLSMQWQNVVQWTMLIYWPVEGGCQTISNYS